MSAAQAGLSPIGLDIGARCVKDAQVVRRRRVGRMGAACPHESAEELLAPVEGAGFEVVALDHPGWALARCLPNAGARAVLDLGWTGAVLVLVHEGAVRYERAIEGGALGALHARLAE